MPKHLVALSLVMAALPAVALPAQDPASAEFTLKKCDDPKRPFGDMRRTIGDISFSLDKTGKPDTATINVTHALGMSVAGFKSVAARQLVGCRFDVDKAALTTSIVVRSHVTAGDTVVTIGPAARDATPAPALALERFDIPKDSMPLRWADARIDEQPRQLRCKPPPSPSIRAQGSGPSRAAAQQAASADAATQYDGWNQTHAGTLFAEILVKADGRPGNQVRVLDVNNPAAATGLAEMLGGCDYAPARYRGVAIAAMLQTRATIQNIVVR